MRERRGRTVALLVSGLGVSVLIAGAALFQPAFLEWWYRIPVVRTWGDLLAQRPMELGGAGFSQKRLKARVGIEATRCPRWSGVLLYCLAEGFEPGATRIGGHLGPLVVSVTGEGTGAEALYAVSVSEERKLASHDSPLLFLRSIPIPRAGRYKVELLSLDKKLLRSVLVEGTLEPFHPWMPFEAPPPMDLQLQRTPEVKVIAGAVSNPSAGIAIPSWDGSIPYPSPETKKAFSDPGLPLPSLLPRASQPAMKLDFKDSTLVLNASEELIGERLHRHFLSRWWINGEPYVPQQALRDDSEHGHGGGFSRTAKSFRLQLDFDPARIGARPGDRIGVQLLYLDRGWKFVDGESLETMNHMDGRALLSERVEFTAP